MTVAYKLLIVFRCALSIHPILLMFANHWQVMKQFNNN